MIRIFFLEDQCDVNRVGLLCLLSWCDIILRMVMNACMVTLKTGLSRTSILDSRLRPCMYMKVPDKTFLFFLFTHILCLLC